MKRTILLWWHAQRARHYLICLSAAVRHRRVADALRYSDLHAHHAERVRALAGHR